MGVTSIAKYCSFYHALGDWANDHCVGIQTQWAFSYLDFSHSICYMMPIFRLIGSHNDALDL